MKAVERLIEAVGDASRLAPFGLKDIKFRETIGHISVVARIRFGPEFELDALWNTVRQLIDLAEPCEFNMRHLRDLSDSAKPRAYIVFDDQNWIG
jgi:hypothetical protein